MDPLDIVMKLHIPSGYRYSPHHTWAYSEGNGRFHMVGVTPLIGAWLAKVHDIFLPKEQTEIFAGETVARIAGLSSYDRQPVTVPIISPLGGIVGGVNELLQKRFLRRAKTERIRSDPYDSGYIFSVMCQDTGRADDTLMDADAYRRFLGERVIKYPNYLYQFTEWEFSNASFTGGVFISYRRMDTLQWAKRLGRSLERFYGAHRVFLDIASNRGGKDYRKEIEAFIKKADLIVLLIGPDFFGEKNKAGKTRLQEVNDPVRIELNLALSIGKDVYPLLVDGAKQPLEHDFPEDIREIIFRQTERITSNDELDTFVASLRPGIEVSAGRLPGSTPRLKGLEPSREVYAQARTAAIKQLIEMGWQFGNRYGDGNLGHPEFPQFRIRTDEVESNGQIWLDEYKTRRFNRDGWAPVHGFSISPELPHDAKLIGLPDKLKQAAANPLAYVNKHGRLPDDNRLPIISKLEARRKRPPMAKGQLFKMVRHSIDEEAVRETELQQRSFRKGLKQATMTLNPAGTLRCGKGRVFSVAFSPNGKFLAAGLQNGALQIWDTSSFKKIAEFRHPEYVKSIAFRPDGHLVSGSGDGYVRTWNLSARREIDRYRRPGTWRKLFKRLDDTITGVACSPDGKWIAVSSFEAKIWLWNTVSGEPFPLEYGQPHQRPEALAFHPKGRILAAGGVHDAIFLFDIVARQKTGALKQGNMTRDLSFTPDGKMLAAACYHGAIYLQNMSSGQLIQTLRGHNPVYKGFPASVCGVAFSPDGRWLVSSGSGEQLILWNTATWMPEVIHPCHSQILSGIKSLAWSPDGRRVAMPGEEGMVQLWELARREKRRT
jgi:WD40 repeat protein/glycine cleavage system H lipoate-binding protein